MITEALIVAATCFAVDSPDSPENLPADGSVTESIWCYAESGSESLVFNADGGRFLPELTALYERDPEGRLRSITTGSRAKGKLRTIKSRYIGLDPLPAPAAKEKMGRHARRAHAGVAAAEAQRLGKILRDFRAAPLAKDDPIRIEAGSQEYLLPEEAYPYDAYWWPHSAVELAAGPGSPLGKYDAMIEARTGTNPGASAWEARMHSLQTVSWGGHCNGWAASAILHEEVDAPRWDPLTQQNVLISDFNGMLAEASFCVYWTFYGRRNNAGPADDPLDIYPDVFHKALVHYLRDEGKPLAMDYYPNESVDNNVISGASFVIAPVDGEANTFKVDATLRMHGYDFERDEALGFAASAIHQRVYSYKLVLDAAGEIVSGTWLSENPDFLWVPLAQRLCGRENPNIDHDAVLGLMRDLPVATRRHRPLALDIAVELQPNEVVVLPALPPSAGLVGLTIGAGSATAGLAVVARGLPLYPNQGQSAPMEVTRTLAELAAGGQIPLQTFESLHLVNQTEAPSSAPIRIDSVEYLTGAE